MPDIAAARPTAGGPVETSWGQQMHDAVETLKLTAILPRIAIVNGESQAADVVKKAVVIPGLAPSTKKRWAQVYVSCTSGTSSGSIAVYHAGAGSTDFAMNASGPGVAGRYGQNNALILLGGTNNDQISYSIDVAGDPVQAYLFITAILEGV